MNPCFQPLHILRLWVCCCTLLPFTLAAQAPDLSDVELDRGWNFGAGLGVDLGQLLQLNPRVGAGENRVGIGTSFTSFARYRGERLKWANNLSLNFAIQKLGAGVLPPGFNANTKVPFQKSIDELRVSSQVSYTFSDNSPWGYGTEATFITQITPTYQDKGGRNLLKTIDAANEGKPIAKFLNTATFTFSPGITYHPNEQFNVLLSPASYKTVFLTDSSIANVRGKNGKKLYDYLDLRADGTRSLHQLGASLRANYSNAFLADDRLMVKSTLGLFSNYLEKPENVDVDWRNELGVELIDGLTVTLNTILLYDDDVPVQISDYDAVGGFKRNADGDVVLGKRVSFTEQILIKYAIVF